MAHRSSRKRVAFGFAEQAGEHRPSRAVERGGGGVPVVRGHAAGDFGVGHRRHARLMAPLPPARAPFLAPKAATRINRRAG